MKKKLYPLSILATFDYLTTSLFLSDIARKIRLNDYDPVVEQLGPAPIAEGDDPIQYWHYSVKAVHFLRNLEIANKNAVDKVIRDSMNEWPKLNPCFHLDILTKNQLYFLDRRISCARQALELANLPVKSGTDEDNDKDMDMFFPAICLHYLMDNLTWLPLPEIGSIG